jgi:hypothetical protein
MWNEAPSRRPPASRDSDLPTLEEELDGTKDVHRRKDRASVTVLTGADAGMLFGVTEGELTCGRSPRARCRLRDDAVAPLHARIFERDGKYWVEDLGSSASNVGSRDELVALCPDTTLRNGLILAERVRSSIEHLVLSAAGNDVKITISVGVAASNDGLEGMVSLIAAADRAMYSAKRRGRNRVAGARSHPEGSLLVMR